MIICTCRYVTDFYVICQIDNVCTEYSFVKTNKQVHQEASFGDGYAKDKKKNHLKKMGKMHGSLSQEIKRAICLMTSVNMMNRVETEMNSLKRPQCKPACFQAPQGIKK